MTLRRRLVLSIVALVVAVSAVIGGGSIIALFSIQRSAIDEQLQYATSRAQRSVEQQGPNGPEFGRPSAQAAGTLTVYILDGNAVVGSLLDNSGQAERLSTAVVRPLSGLAVDGQPHTG
jgi:two-component system OmpR family sensor kinase